ncbi:MAG: hypothetical protein R3E88_19670 [Myxococcota bacterium]|nr:hypothetical protein [Myxococcales bacterium]
MAIDEQDLEGGGGVPDFLRDPMGILTRHWRWICLGALVGVGVTAFLVATWKPVYVAKASILVASQQIPQEFVRTTVPEDPFSRLNAMVSEVLSRQKLVALIEEFELYGDMRAQMPLEEVVGTMRSKITIQAQGGQRHNTGETARVYMISYEADDPKVAAAVANRLAGLFLEAGIQSRMERAEEISRFLRQELKRSEELLREQNRAIAEFNEQYRGELPSELGANLQKLERLQQQKQSLEVQIMDAEARIATLPATNDPNSPEARLAALRQRYDAELAVHTDEHPTVIALRRQIEALEAAVAGSTSLGTSHSALVLGAQQQIATLRTQLANVEGELAVLDSRVARTPKRGEELAALTEKASVSREKYLDFLRKVNAAELAQTLENAQQGAQVSILDRAFPPRTPESSRTRRILTGIAAIFGLALGAGLFREFLDPVLVHSDQAEKITGLPELGSVAHIG